MSFQTGFVSALGLGEIWNNQRSTPKVYIERTRVHHYQVGIAVFLLGALLRSPTLTGFGVGLFLHDIDDVPF